MCDWLLQIYTLMSACLKCDHIVGTYSSSGFVDGQVTSIIRKALKSTKQSLHVIVFDSDLCPDWSNILEQAIESGMWCLPNGERLLLDDVRFVWEVRFWAM